MTFLTGLVFVFWLLLVSLHTWFIYNLYGVQLYLTSCCQSLTCVWLFAAPWPAACQASLYFTLSLNLLKLMSIESMMLSNHLTCPFSSCSQSFPSASVPVSQLLVSHGQNTGAVFPHILLKQNNKILTEAPSLCLSLSLSLCSENIHLVWSVPVLDHFEITYSHAQL